MGNVQQIRPDGALWEAFANGYTNVVLKTLEDTREISTSMRDQIDQSAAAAARVYLVVTLSSIKALERQLTELGQKVDQLMQDTH